MVRLASAAPPYAARDLCAKGDLIRRTHRRRPTQRRFQFATRAIERDTRVSEGWHDPGGGLPRPLSRHRASELAPGLLLECHRIVPVADVKETQPYRVHGLDGILEALVEEPHRAILLRPK
jgi:hypothetical protein